MSHGKGYQGENDLGEVEKKLEGMADAAGRIAANLDRFADHLQSLNHVAGRAIAQSIMLSGPFPGMSFDARRMMEFSAFRSSLPPVPSSLFPRVPPFGSPRMPKPEGWAGMSEDGELLTESKATKEDRDRYRDHLRSANAKNVNKVPPAGGGPQARPAGGGGPPREIEEKKFFSLGSQAFARASEVLNRIFRRGGGGGGGGGGGEGNSSPRFPDLPPFKPAPYLSDELPKVGHRLSELTLALSAATTGILRAGAPDAYDTLSKSARLAAASLSSGFIPAAASLSRGLQDMSAKFDKLSPETKEKIGNYTTAAVVLGGVALMGGKLISIFGGLARGVAAFGASLGMRSFAGAGAGAAGIVPAVSGWKTAAAGVGGGLAGAFGAGRIAEAMGAPPLGVAAAEIGGGVAGSVGGVALLNYMAARRAASAAGASAATMGGDLVGPATAGAGGAAGRAGWLARNRGMFMRGGLAAAILYGVNEVTAGSTDDPRDRGVVRKAGGTAKRSLDAAWDETIGRFWTTGDERDRARARRRYEERDQWGYEGHALGAGMSAKAGDERRSYLAAFASRVNPQYMSVEDVYKQVQLSALGDDPLTAAINAKENENQARMLDALNGANEKLDAIKEGVRSINVVGR
jgi:hypothetical protein